MLVSLSGTRNGVDWPQRGEVIDLPNEEAVKAINSGLAEAVSDEPKVEAAVVESKPAPRKRTSGLTKANTGL